MTLPREDEQFAGEREYLETLSGRCALPAGFASSTTTLQFTPAERPTAEPYSMNLALLASVDAPATFAGVFTRNVFAGAPVLQARERLQRGALRGILVNNRIANVCSPTGREDAERLTAELAGALETRAGELLSVSTGIIGWALPVAEMTARIPELAEGLEAGSAVDAARAIMTTDSFPKARRAAVGEGSLVGIAKGAGMVEPNMATMLVFLFTDASVDRGLLQRALSETVDATFNRISIDGDQSTSDMVVALSSGREAPCGEEELRHALHEVCAGLAEDVVRNGEGVSHVMRVRVTGVDEQSDAVALGKAVVNSPLVKTAVYGNDPNVGRIVSAIGDHAGNCSLQIDRERVSVYLGSEPVFSAGAFLLDREKEVRLSDYLKSAAMNPRLRGYPQHHRCVEVGIDLGRGSEEATVLGCDLSDEYVHENADYRS